MVRVCLKNTFLEFEEAENSEARSIRESASPRSRSAEAPMSPPRKDSDFQESITEAQLNERFRDFDLSLPPDRSPLRSPTAGTPRQRANSGQLSPPQQGAIASSAARAGYPTQEAQLPSDPRGMDPRTWLPVSSNGNAVQEDASATAKHMRHLQRRLEAQQQQQQRTPFRHVNSNMSLSSMCSESGEECTDGGKRYPMHKVWSSNSVSTLGSDFVDEPADEGNILFTLNIEEEPSKPSAFQERPDALAHAAAVEPMGCPPPTRLSGGNGVDRQQQQRNLPKEYRHGHVPKNLDLAEEFRRASDERPPTTLMIRNIPNRYTQRELIVELEALGFAGTFDFLYVPLDKGTMSNVGYAFVNFVDPQNADKCMQAFHGYRFKRHRKVSGKIAAVSVAHIQGLEANLAHYKNAAVNTAKMKQRRPLVMANISQSILKAVGGNTSPEADQANAGATLSNMQELQF